jgi:hypothetical protein
MAASDKEVKEVADAIWLDIIFLFCCCCCHQVWAHGCV